jgi:uncharacterized membrane protein
MILGIVVLVGLLLYVTARVSRPGLFFGVTVDQAFTGSDTAQRIKRRYGLEIIVHSAVAMALVFAFGLAPAVLWQVWGDAWAFDYARRAAMPYAVVESAIREADLDPHPKESLFVTVLALAPLALLFLLALYAHSHWDRIPNPFPVHFRGPNDWFVSGPYGIYGLILLNIVLCGLMLMTRYGLRHWSRRVAIDGATAQAEARFRRIVTWVLVAAQYLMVALTWVALLSRALVAVVLAFGMLVLTVFLVFVLLRIGQAGNRMVSGGPSSDRTPDACWKWGMFYINPNDPALFVEKRFGIGYTVNLGNRWSWILVVITLLSLIFLR